MYHFAIQDLYNIEAQARLQQVLVSPTSLHGTVNIFTYPPFIALAFSTFSWFPLPYSFAIYIASLWFLAFLSIELIYRRLLPEKIKDKVSKIQLAIIVFSSLPFILGIFFGQNSVLTLFLLTLIVITCRKKKWLLAGLLGGFLLFKPHFILGFLILWLSWRQFDALLGFGLVSLAWVGAALARYGLAPFQAYIQALPQFMDFPYAPGIKLDVSPYAFFLTVLPTEYNQIVKIVYYLFIAALAIFLGLVALKFRPSSTSDPLPAMTLALLFPFLISPHTLIYDLIPLILPLVLWARLKPSKVLLELTIFTYLGSLILPMLTKLIPVHLLVLLPVSLAIFFIKDLKKSFLSSNLGSMSYD
jgi:hypothetical protein